MPRMPPRLARLFPLASLLLLALLGCAARPLPRLIALPHLPSSSTRLALPPLGRVQADRLVDGDLVWVVRTSDNEVHVLAADAHLVRGGWSGRVLVSFDPACNCFVGLAPVAWGLDGAIVARTEPDYAPFGGLALGIRRSFDGVTAFRLDRFEVTRDGENIEVGARWRATAYATPEDPPQTVMLDTRSPRVECAVTMGATSLSDAMEEPEGRMVLLNASVSRLHGLVRLCPTNDPCSDVPVDLGDAWQPEHDADEVLVPGPLLARRARDGFSEFIAASFCPHTCSAPSHDASWLRTPVGASEGPRIDAPISCDADGERVAPGVRMIRVHGSGTRALADGTGAAMPEPCRLPNSDRTLCPEVPAAALYEALFATLREHEGIAFGIGGCFDSGRSTLGRMAAVVHDWRDADAAIRIVSDELTRWDVRDSFWVSVEPVLCGALAGELAR